MTPASAAPAPDAAPRRGLRVLVTGGRGYDDAVAVWEALDALHRAEGIALVIHGAAKGADRLGALWAKGRGVPDDPHPAAWRRPDGTTDKGAGLRRNLEMLDLAPDAVVAFPGGTGTGHCVDNARRRGLRVILAG